MYITLLYWTLTFAVFEVFVGEFEEQGSGGARLAVTKLELCMSSRAWQLRDLQDRQVVPVTRTQIQLNYIERDNFLIGFMQQMNQQHLRGQNSNISYLSFFPSEAELFDFTEVTG